MKRLLCFIALLLLFFESMEAQIAKAIKNENGKYGCVDNKGKWIVEPQYDEIIWHADKKYGTLIDYSTHTEGLIDNYGRVVVPIGKYTIYKTYWNEEKKSFYVDVADESKRRGEKERADGGISTGSSTGKSVKTR